MTLDHIGFNVSDFPKTKQFLPVARWQHRRSHKSMTACDPRLTFTAPNLADAKQPVARHEQPNYRQTQLRNERRPPLHELRR